MTTEFFVFYWVGWFCITGFMLFVGVTAYLKLFETILEKILFGKQ